MLDNLAARTAVAASRIGEAVQEIGGPKFLDGERSKAGSPLRPVFS
jgi:hypothetical protein